MNLKMTVCIANCIFTHACWNKCGYRGDPRGPDPYLFPEIRPAKGSDYLPSPLSGAAKIPESNHNRSTILFSLWYQRVVGSCQSIGQVQDLSLWYDRIVCGTRICTLPPVISYGGYFEGFYQPLSKHYLHDLKDAVSPNKLNCACQWSNITPLSILSEKKCDGFSNAFSERVLWHPWQKQE